MKHVSCSCGYVARAETGDELLAVVEAHIAAVHAPEWSDREPDREAPKPPVPRRRRNDDTSVVGHETPGIQAD